MCGIFLFIELLKNKTGVDYSKLFQDFMNLRPRGPDMSNFQIIKNVTIGFHRLAIMDPTFHANQPYILEDGDRTIMFICNGEIYNFKELIKEHNLDITTKSDCMTIPMLYKKYVKYNDDGTSTIDKFTDLFSNNIMGEYAFTLLEFDNNQNLKHLVIGRDMIGVRPLYVGHMVNESIIFSSEIKGMMNYTGNVNEYEPGTIMHYTFNNNNIVSNKKYDFKTVYNIVPQDENLFTDIDAKEAELLTNVRKAVTNSVQRRLDADRPISFLLSGGVDSSIVAALSAKILGKQIDTFCCAISKESTDLINARLVAKHIKSNHTEIIVSENDAIDMIKQVIFNTESWCTTTIRASIGQHIVCNYIGKNTDAKVIYCGEGPDEVASSYLHQWYAPSSNALHESAMEYIKEIHMFDVKRADRNISGASCEGRVPLLDPEFITAYWAIPSKWRMPVYKNMEKWWLRKSFDGTDLLPDSILWRKKEAFSDGISSTEKSWFQILQEYIDTQVSDKEFTTQNEFNCPTKEAYYYMKIFISFFGKNRINIINHYWQAKFKSDGSIVDFNDLKSYSDPSARTLKIYSDIKHQ